MEIEIQNTKIELIQWLTTIEDADLLQKILEIKKEESKDWWDKISEAERNSVEKGLTDADNGRLNPHSEAFKIYGKYL